jgi:Helix-turn-helix domain
MSVHWGWSQPVDATLYLEGGMECALMVYRFHRGFTAAEKTELWDRWKRGESLKAIGRAFGKPSSSIYFLVAPHGGIRPAQRRRSRLALTLALREVISRGVTADQSARSIAKLLGRSPSTVCREISRNGGYDSYRPALADEKAWARARRPKCCKLANSPRLTSLLATGRVNVAAIQRNGSSWQRAASVAPSGQPRGFPCVDDEVTDWLECRERRKGLRKNPDNRHGHREADTCCTAKHHHEI